MDRLHARPLVCSGPQCRTMSRLPSVYASRTGAPVLGRGRAKTASNLALSQLQYGACELRAFGHQCVVAIIGRCCAGSGTRSPASDVGVRVGRVRWRPGGSTLSTATSIGRRIGRCFCVAAESCAAHSVGM